MSSSPYHEACTLLNEVFSSQKGLKTIVFGRNKSDKMKYSKSSYALVCQTLKTKPHIDSILEHNNKHLHSTILSKSRNIGLAYILLYELLFGKYQRIRGGGALKRCIIKEEENLRKAKALLCQDLHLGEINDHQNPMVKFPRYVRVNTLKSDTSAVTSALAKLDSQLMVYADAHVPDLLVLPPSAASLLHSHHLLKEGKIVLQDKSSCFPALALVHTHSCDTKKGALGEIHDPFWLECLESSQRGRVDIIDGFAAPGNKTSHIVALLQKELEHAQTLRSSLIPLQSTVFAFDRSSDRIKTLNKRMESLIPFYSAQHCIQSDNNRAPEVARTPQPKIQVQTLHQDFLKIDPSDERWAHVRAILLDPSCSGSGIVNQPDLHVSSKAHDEKEHERLKTLSNFQLVALKHAMSFPHVQRIVYSTCSVNDEENECVVAAALKEYQQSSIQTTSSKESEDSEPRNDLSTPNLNHTHLKDWRVVSPDCLRTWIRRGRFLSGLRDVITKEMSNAFIRCSGTPECGSHDDTNGFFVCCLERGPLRSYKSNISLDTVKCTKSSKLINGLPIYNGEYSRTEFTSKHDPKFTPTEKSPQPLNPLIHKKHRENSHTRSSTTENSSDVKKDSTTGRALRVPSEHQVCNPDNATKEKDVTHSNKRHKKAEWKLRQKRLKQERISSTKKKGD